MRNTDTIHFPTQYDKFLLEFSRTEAQTLLDNGAKFLIVFFHRTEKYKFIRTVLFWKTSAELKYYIRAFICTLEMSAFDVWMWASKRKRV